MPNITGHTRSGHQYWKLDGRIMPSPSKIKLSGFENRRWMAEQVVNDINASDLLKTITDDHQWRTEAVKIGEKSLSYAADRGRECHRIMEAITNGKSATVGDPSIVTDPVLAARLRADPTVRRDAECAARSIDDFGITPLLTEQPVINRRIWYSGLADLVATCPSFGDDQPTIVDYKFTKSVRDEYALQVSAYAHVTDLIVRTKHRGPRGGKLPDTWEMSPITDLRQDRAYVLNTTDGYSQMVPIVTDGDIWKAVQAWVIAFWAFQPNDDNPILDPIQPKESNR